MHEGYHVVAYNVWKTQAKQTATGKTLMRDGHGRGSNYKQLCYYA